MKPDFMRSVMDAKELVDDLPDLPAFRAMYPRKYQEPAGWYSPKIYAYGVAGMVEHMPSVPPDAYNTIWEMSCAARLAEARVPTWWVGEELLLSLLDTVPPADIKLMDIKWTMPAMLFILPIALTRTVFKRNIPFLAGARAPVNESVFLPADTRGKRHQLHLASKQPDTLHSIVIKAGSYYLNGDIDGTLSMHLPVTENVTVRDTLTRDWPEGFSYELGAGFDEGDKTRMDKFAALFLQLVLLLSMRGAAMQSGGHLLVGATTVGSGKDKRVLKPSLFAPKWVGQYYRRPQKPYLGGTHASPEVHLRKGHWRDQRVGKGRAEIKPTWIEPVWVNAQNV